MLQNTIAATGWEASTSELPKPKKSNKANASALSEKMFVYFNGGFAVAAETRCEIFGDNSVLGEDTMKNACKGQVLSVNADDNYDAFLVICLGSFTEKQLFCAHSEVMFFIDGTLHKTKKENRPSLQWELRPTIEKCKSFIVHLSQG